LIFHYKIIYIEYIMSLTGGKRKVNKSLKAWVAFVKKVQKEEKLSYKDAIHRAKVRKDKGEKWMTGGQNTPATDTEGLSGVADMFNENAVADKNAANVDQLDAVANEDLAMDVDDMAMDVDDMAMNADDMNAADTTQGGRRRRRTMRRSRGRGRGRGRGRTARRSRGRASRRR
jgi:hypothetical protein